MKQAVIIRKITSVDVIAIISECSPPLVSAPARSLFGRSRYTLTWSSLSPALLTLTKVITVRTYIETLNFSLIVKGKYAQWELVCNHLCPASTHRYTCLYSLQFIELQLNCCIKYISIVYKVSLVSFPQLFNNLYPRNLQHPQYVTLTFAIVSHYSFLSEAPMWEIQLMPVP